MDFVIKSTQSNLVITALKAVDCKNTTHKCDTLNMESILIKLCHNYAISTLFISNKLMALELAVNKFDRWNIPVLCNIFCSYNTGLSWSFVLSSYNI